MSLAATSHPTSRSLSSTYFVNQGLLLRALPYAHNCSHEEISKLWCLLDDPVLMVLSLVTAAMFSLGHHFYYSSLAGQVSPTEHFRIAGQAISRQQFHISVGNTFAYLVKTFLFLAVAMAYAQAFWFFAQKAKGTATLSELDIIYSALSNILAILRLRVWRTFPVMLILAVVSWSLNIASLITPATLSVQSILHRNSSLVQVPQFSFTTLNFVGGMQQNAGILDFSRLYAFNGPSQRVQRIATAVAGVGEVLPITPPASNTSWTLDLWAPTVQCSEVSGEERDHIWINIWNSINSRYGSNCEQSYAYLSWTPCAVNPLNTTLTTTLPFSPGAQYSPAGFCGNDTMNFDGGPVVMYVATLPSLASATVYADVQSPSSCTISFPGDQPACNLPYHDNSTCLCPHFNTTDLNQFVAYTPSDGRANQCLGYTPAEFFKDASLTSCKFFNTSLALDFMYPNGLQGIEVRKRSEPPSPIVGSAYEVAGPAYGNEPTSYPGNSSNCSVLVLRTQTIPLEESGGDSWPGCTFDPSAARRLSYQVIISAFNKLVLGFGAFKRSAAPGLNVNILDTVLVDTEELAFLRSGGKSSNTGPQGDLTNLQNMINNGTQWAYQGLADLVPSGSRGSLRDTLEELFQNFTISLLADPYLQPNYSSPFAPERLTNVTSELTLNIYVYARTTLWLAYGLAILLASLIVAFGATLMITQNASYNSDFSTIFRSSRAAEINVEVSSEDARAQEPLPKHLARARVRFNGHPSAEAEGKHEQFVTTESLLACEDPDTEALRSEAVPDLQLLAMAARHTM